MAKIDEELVASMVAAGYATAEVLAGRPPAPPRRRVGGQVTISAKDLEEHARALGQQLRASLPVGTGFTLLVFDYGATGSAAYVSSADRAGSVEALRELLRKILAGIDPGAYPDRPGGDE